MNKELIKKIVADAFERNYIGGREEERDEYKLIFIGEATNSISCIIICDENVIVEFIVSENGIFNARSHGSLLSLRYEISNWYGFLKEVDNTCREKRKVYEDSEL